MGPVGTRLELYEPGARVLYVKERYEYARPDKSTGTKLVRARGVVERATERYVFIDGERVAKADVLGPDRVPEGHRVYHLAVHHVNGTRLDRIKESGTTLQDAQGRLQSKLDKFHHGRWVVGGGPWLKEETI